MGIPNICFSLTDADDNREHRYKKQRLERGFDNSELWSLYYIIAKFIYPRLVEFRKSTPGYPGNLTEKKWDTILGKMERAFELIIDDERCYNVGENKEIEIGLNLFRKWFFALWS